MSLLTECLIPLGEIVVITIALWVAYVAIRSDIVTAISHLKDSTKTAKKNQCKVNAEKDEPIMGKTIPGGKLYKRTVIYLSGGLIIPIAETVGYFFESPQEEKKSKPIVGLMLGGNPCRASECAGGGNVYALAAITRSFMRVAPRCAKATRA